MKIVQSLKLRDRLVSRVDDAFYWSTRGKETSAQLNERIIAVLRDSEPACKRMPYWLTAYVDGYVDAIRKPLQRTMVYGAWLDHSFYDAFNKESPCYVENRGLTWKQFGDITNNPDALVGHWWPSDVTRAWWARPGETLTLSVERKVLVNGEPMRKDGAS
jgi:hypothetical protein